MECHLPRYSADMEGVGLPMPVFLALKLGLGPFASGPSPPSSSEATCKTIVESDLHASSNVFYWMTSHCITLDVRACLCKPYRSCPVTLDNCIDPWRSITSRCRSVHWFKQKCGPLTAHLIPHQCPQTEAVSSTHCLSPWPQGRHLLQPVACLCFLQALLLICSVKQTAGSMYLMVLCCNIWVVFSSNACAGLYSPVTAVPARERFTWSMRSFLSAYGIFPGSWAVLLLNSLPQRCYHQCVCCQNLFTHCMCIRHCYCNIDDGLSQESINSGIVNRLSRLTYWESKKRERCDSMPLQISPHTSRQANRPASHVKMRSWIDDWWHGIRMPS